ncbi:Helicase associated domain-containing protein [Phytophthora infestans]|uniref:Helicase associated domain-containing protein n=1 Tax=Phytophthora infestans TaxID=4787 RepID=A0A8S9VF00_PHYIN|nr:Helicase associated domain-containing protein [Phytophthora infestans]
MISIVLWRGRKAALQVPRKGHSSLLFRCLSVVPLKGKDGSEEDANFSITNRWGKQFLPALRAYKELKGDTLVPIAFVIPTGDDHWPRETWGYSLGRGVTHIRSRLTSDESHKLPPSLVRELEELDLAQNASQYRWDNAILPALRCFYGVYGHSDVPGLFVVPRGDSKWPKASWGLALGAITNHIRLGNTYVTQVAASMEELKGMDLCLAAIVDRNWTEKILPSLATYQQEFGHCLVKISFIVPSQAPWPEKAWGMLLGKTVNPIRSRLSYSRHALRDAEILKSLDFVWDVDEYVWTERIVPALKAYVAQNGHCLVPGRFVVPSHDPWPKKAWGMKLGQTVSNIRLRYNYRRLVLRDKEILTSLEFTWNVKDYVWTERFVPALKVYVAQNGHCLVPASFVVPSHDPWPKKAWGVKLGEILKRIRSARSYFSHFGRNAEVLESLGLSLQLTPKGYENRVSPLLETYASIKGSRDIPDNFVIPPEDPWPETVWGVRLGLIVARNTHHFS